MGVVVVGVVVVGVVSIVVVSRLVNTNDGRDAKEEQLNQRAIKPGSGSRPGLTAHWFNGSKLIVLVS